MLISSYIYMHKLENSWSRNLTGPKTLPTIWYTYMMLVTKYQISAINSSREKCDEKYLGRTEGRTEVKQYTPRNLIFGHKLHIGTPYRGKCFGIHRIPTSCLPTLLIFLHIEHICSFFVAFFSATIDGRNLIFDQLIPDFTWYLSWKCRNHYK
jgi:hypothetical protein